MYAVEMNHRKERLLNGAALESVASRPAMLITGAAVMMTSIVQYTKAAFPSMAKNSFATL